MRLEPIGEQRADLRAGAICATVANYAGKVRAEGVAPAVPADFMPHLKSSLPHQAASLLMETPEEQAALLKKTLFGAN